jgi:hypothetical protein
MIYFTALKATPLQSQNAADRIAISSHRNLWRGVHIVGGGGGGRIKSRVSACEWLHSLGISACLDHNRPAYNWPDIQAAGEGVQATKSRQCTTGMQQ